MDTYVHTTLLCFPIKFKATKPVPPEDVKDAFLKYSGDDCQMTAEQLRRFLKEVQREEDASIDDAEKIIRKVREELKLQKRNAFTCAEFHHYLFSTALNPPIGSEVKEDTLKAPLTHYFIFTGHNSYLKGNQLTSKSCVEPIIKSLKRGVRVVELDLWPNKHDIKVVHGRTMTKPVALIECLKVIDKHAFEASQYPVILTLEDHLPPHLQHKVAKMVRETFGEKLYVPETELQECPSPADLKGKILVSTKTPKEYYEEIEYEKNNMRQDNEDEYDEDDDDRDDPDDDEQDNIGKNGKEQLLRSKSRFKRRKAKRIRWDRQGNRETVRKRILYAIFPYLRAKYRIKAHNYKIDGEASENEEKLAYRELIAIHAGKLKGALKEAFRGGHELDKVRRVSLTEQSLEKAIDQSHGHGITRFTRKNFLRVYPKGTRFNSSNYNPFLGWMHGAQMVAFNMQGHGRHLWAMSGMFRGNGGCGYVKKPDILLNPTSANLIFNPKSNLPIKNTLKVKVYSTDGWLSDFKLTHFDLHSPPDFYVRVGIAGVPADKRMKRTEVKMDEWSPVWNKEFSFPLTVPELALLRIEVHEYDSLGDDFAGQTCLPVLELRSGFRAVPLYCRKGKPYQSVRLLMRFNLE